MNIKKLNEDLQNVLIENDSDIHGDTYTVEYGKSLKVQILPSETRRPEVQGKFYAYTKEPLNSIFTTNTDDYDTEEEAMKAFTKQFEDNGYPIVKVY